MSTARLDDRSGDTQATTRRADANLVLAVFLGAAMLARHILDDRGGAQLHGLIQAAYGLPSATVFGGIAGGALRCIRGTWLFAGIGNGTRHVFLALRVVFVPLLFATVLMLTGMLTDAGPGALIGAAVVVAVAGLASLFAHRHRRSARGHA